ncbi:MAG: LysR family transcriptional regulator [Pigmentiphaga sp.]|nr:LysR family transcriptional regulator [Pigmentiphaga sp.]
MFLEMQGTLSPPGPAHVGGGLAWPLPPPATRPWIEAWRHWRVALAVANESTAAAAGRALHLSPSAVARSLNHLETQLELRLFERSSRGMAPTAAAGLLLPRIAQAFAQIELAECELRHWQPAGETRRPRLAGLGFRPWQAFLAVAAVGSEVEAAAMLGISQPAISQAVRQLQHQAGVPVLARGRRSLQLSDPGEVLLRRARLAWSEFRMAAEDWASRHGSLTGRLVVGTLPLSSGGLVPLSIDRLLVRHPEASVTVVDGTYDTLLRQLRHAEVDVIVGALREPPPLPDICQEALFEDRLQVVARSRHPALAAAPRSLAELKTANWIVPLAGTPWRAAFERAFRAEGLAPPADRLSANSGAVIRTLLLETDRLALISPSLVQRELDTGALRRIEMTVRDTTRMIGTARRVQRPSAVTGAWLGILRELAGQPGIMGAYK